MVRCEVLLSPSGSEEGIGRPGSWAGCVASSGPSEIPLVAVQGADHEGGLVILLDVPRFPVGHVGFPLPHAAKDEFIFFSVKWCPPSEGLIF